MDHDDHIHPTLERQAAAEHQGAHLALETIAHHGPFEATLGAQADSRDGSSGGPGPEGEMPPAHPPPPSIDSAEGLRAFESSRGGRIRQ